MIGVIVQDNEPIDKALKRFKKKYERSGILREYRRHMFYLKPSEQRKIERMKSLRRQQRLREEEEGES